MHNDYHEARCDAHPVDPHRLLRSALIILSAICRIILIGISELLYDKNSELFSVSDINLLSGAQSGIYQPELVQYLPESMSPLKSGFYTGRAISD